MLSFITTLCLWLVVTAFLLYLLGLLISLHGRYQLSHFRQSGKSSGDENRESHYVKPIIIGFFHPYCNAGGGGERVLWVAIRALQKRYSHVKCVVYTGDTDVKAEEFIQKAKCRFNIVIPRTGPESIQFIYLKGRSLVEAKYYPFFTMLGQSFGSLLLGIEALWKFVPNVYIDSMGYAFTLPLFKYLGGCSIACYVHYPTISTDMLQRVVQRTNAYNNPSRIARSRVLSFAKMIYYRAFAYLYGLVGQRSDLIMVNSSWTQDHILKIWQAPKKTFVIYPPCDTREFIKLPLNDKAQPQKIVSIAQFRPEKDHPLQLKAFHKFLETKQDNKEYNLVLVGSCRNEEDQKRVNDLKQLANDLNITKHVEFRLNVAFDDLKKCLCEATIGLHTMWNEHFGIGVVEMLAAGTIVLAHGSGGPKMDIVKTPSETECRTGYLAYDVDSYAAAMAEILQLPAAEMQQIQLAARDSVDRFSDQTFEASFIEALQQAIL